MNFNRRARDVCRLMGRMRRHVVERMDVHDMPCQPEFLLTDGTPVKVRHRAGARSVWGILSRIIAKMTGNTLAADSNRRQGQSPLRPAEFAF